MLKRILLITAMALVSIVATSTHSEASPPGQPADWQRFYHYPYVYYPHTFQKPQQFDSMYHKYPQSMQIPVYNKSWYNFYPTEKIWHKGHHFVLDVF